MCFSKCDCGGGRESRNYVDPPDTPVVIVDTLIIAPTKGTTEIETLVPPPPVTSLQKKKPLEPVEQARKPRKNHPVHYPPPVDTTSIPDPTPDPTPTPVGQALLLFDFNGATIEAGQGWNVSSVTGSNMPIESQKQALYKTQAAYAKYNVFITDNQADYDAWTGPKHIIVITPQSSWYPNTSYTGVSFVGSLFGGSKYSWVFEDRLYSNWDYVGSIMIHESGHAIGLSHQSDCVNGSLTNTYSAGKWMGYCFNLSAWVVGYTPYCTNQDDDKILSTNLGIK